MKLSEEPPSTASRAFYPIVILLMTSLITALGLQNCSSSQAVALRNVDSSQASAQNFETQPSGTSIGMQMPSASVSLASLRITSSAFSVMAGMTLKLTPSGGTPPYVFSLQSGGTGAGTVDPNSGIFTGLALGPVLVQVMDSAGLVATAALTVLSALSLPSHVSLSIGKSTSLTATGGQPPITYSVAGVNEGNGAIDAITGVFTGLAAGEVSVTATDSAGNSTTAAVSVTEIQYCVLANQGEAAAVRCPGTSKIKSLDFASFGTPSGGAIGDCTGTPFILGTCDATNSISVVESTCANGTASCSVEASSQTFSDDPCENTPQQLAIQVTCY